jgi:esterase/lipase superfamily enzyme
MKSPAIVLALAWLVTSGFLGGFREANAQTKLTDVVGTVVDVAGASVSDATVVLINRVTNEERTTKTNPSGEFIFHMVPRGSYTLKAVAGGLLAVRNDLELSSESENRINLILHRAETAAPMAPPRPAPDHPVTLLPPLAPPAPVTRELTAEPNYYTMKVFYATDRSPTGQTDAANFYGSDKDPNETLSLGTCEVSIPRDHRPGELEAPSIWKLELHEDPEKHVVLLGVHPETQKQFYSDLASTVAASDDKDAFVFIHGYNTSFKDAARRTGQLAYDLNFRGAAIFYSWPSRGDLDGYPSDEEAIVWTTPHLMAFLQLVALQTRAKTVHLIAHSMGNRALTQALANLATASGGTVKPHFREVILAAPDVDRDIFKQLVGAMEQSADRITLYASSNDEALVASKKLHEGSRAGEAGKSLLVVKGIDTIDVSTVDTSFLGHSYFGDNTSVISDIHRLLTEGSPPSQRSCLSEAFWFNSAYWVFARATCVAQ